MNDPSDSELDPDAKKAPKKSPNKPPKPKSRRDDEDDSVEEPDDALPEIAIADLPPELAQAVKNIGWPSLRPVQARAIPYMLDGRELLVQARTGSGKTGAFVLPMLARLDPNHASCQALVLVPTRELAQQVCDEAEVLAKGSGIRVVSVYGGVGYTQQLDAFKAGAHLVVGTPGRILDHLIRRSLDLDKLQYLVFDEADRMLSMGFYPDMIAIRRYVPKRRRTYMFSATFTPRVRSLAGQFLERPDFLGLSRDRVYVAETTHVYYEAPSMDKDRCLVRVIEVENPDSAIIFCNTKNNVNYVATVLQRFGYDADQLTADLSQNARDKVLTRARAGKLRFLVATDVAARGIDIPGLSHVFLYDWPDDPESYIHRAGRTGRAGATGIAVSLIDVLERTGRQLVAKRFEIDMEKREAPTDDDVQKVVAERTIALLEAKLRDRDRLQIERMARFVPLARTLAESDDELELLAMLLDDYYQETHHDPPPLPASATSPELARPVSQSRDGGGPRRRSGGGGGGGRSGGGGRGRR